MREGLNFRGATVGPEGWHKPSMRVNAALQIGSSPPLFTALEGFFSRLGIRPCHLDVLFPQSWVITRRQPGPRSTAVPLCSELRMSWGL